MPAGLIEHQHGVLIWRQLLRKAIDYRAIVDSTSAAWKVLLAQAGRLSSLCSYPWIQEVLR